MVAANKNSRNKKPIENSSEKISATDKSLGFILVNEFIDTTREHGISFGSSGFTVHNEKYNNWRIDRGDALMYELKSTVAGNIAQRIIFEITDQLGSLEDIWVILPTDIDHDDSFGWAAIPL
ncbi:MAG: hypothetical protein HOP04_13465 [Methylophilaceae bacterium]|nr:hypothetical protein [Methylophilaceae bacterium]